MIWTPLMFLCAILSGWFTMSSILKAVMHEWKPMAINAAIAVLASAGWATIFCMTVLK